MPQNPKTTKRKKEKKKTHCEKTRKTRKTRIFVFRKCGYEYKLLKRRTCESPWAAATHRCASLTTKKSLGGDFMHLCKKTTKKITTTIYMGKKTLLEEYTGPLPRPKEKEERKHKKKKNVRTVRTPCREKKSYPRSEANNPPIEQ